jgi:hypothetical protein
MSIRFLSLKTLKTQSRGLTGMITREFEQMTDRE